MTAKARAWAGATLLGVLILNYLIIGMPLVKKSLAIKEKANAIIIKEVKAGTFLQGSGDDYMLEIFRKEKSSVDRKILILNCVSVSLLIVIGSWTAFGIVLNKKKEK